MRVTIQRGRQANPSTERFEGEANFFSVLRVFVAQLQGNCKLSHCICCAQLPDTLFEVVYQHNQDLWKSYKIHLWQLFLMGYVWAVCELTCQRDPKELTRLAKDSRNSKELSFESVVRMY